MSDIAVVEMVDLPLADSEGAIEKQLKSNNGKFYMVFDPISLSQPKFSLLRIEY